MRGCRAGLHLFRYPIPERNISTTFLLVVRRSWKSVFSPLIQQATSSSKSNGSAFTPNRKLPNFTVPSPDTPNRTQPSPFAPMSRVATVPKVSAAPQSIPNGGFSPLSHPRVGRVNSIPLNSNIPSSTECSSERMRPHAKSKFALKIAQGNREPPVSNASTENSAALTDWPAKRSKISEAPKNTAKTNSSKSNLFQVESDVQSMLDGIDTDSLFGDF